MFDRSGGRVRLTPAGESLRHEAQHIVARVDRSLAVVRQIATGSAGPLRLGVLPETPGQIVAALSAGFAAMAADAVLHMSEYTTTEQMRLLASGELDVGLLRQPVEASPALQLGPTVAIAQGVLIARTSALAIRSELTLSDLAGHELILFPRSAAPGSYDEILRTCRANGFEPSRIQHATSPELVLGLVSAGRAVAFDQYAIAGKEPRVQWRALVDDPMSWRITVAWPASSTHDGVSALATVAEAVLKGQIDGPPLGSRNGYAEARGARPWSVVMPTWHDRTA